ncbi:MAG: hypothetical protein ABEK02_05200 [Haloquadratum sp.]
MNRPEIVQTDLAGDDVVARVDLGGEDELYVTPARTLLYRAEGLLSDESVEEYPHDAERITVSEGRRKAKITLDYGLDGQRTISLPAKRLERALQPLVQGVFETNGVLDDDESIERLFRFSELTIVIAERRVVRHIGASLWDEDFECYHYSDVSDLDFEDGSVATSVVLTVDGRRERFKAPNEDARAVRSALETTLLSYWGVDSIEELRAAAQSDADAGEADAEPTGDDVSFGDGPDPLIADPDEPEERPENATAEETPTSASGTAEETPTESPRSESDAEATDPVTEAVTTQVERPAGADASADADESAQTDRGDQDAVPSETSAGPQRNGSVGAATVSPDASPQSDARGEDAPPASDVTATPKAAADTENEPAEPDDTEERATPERSADRRADRSGTDRETTDPAFEGSGFRSATPASDEDVAAELAELRAAVERQREELEAQRELIEQLIEELRRGR